MSRPFYEVSFGNRFTKPLKRIVVALTKLRILSIDRAVDILANHVMRTKKMRFMGRGKWFRV